MVFYKSILSAMLLIFVYLRMTTTNPPYDENTQSNKNSNLTAVFLFYILKYL